MRHRALLYLNTGVAAIAMAAANEGGGGSNAAAPVEKFYLATAHSRAVDPETKKPTELKFVVGGVDYKGAWAKAREVTRVGTAHFQGKVWTDKTREKEMEIIPGSFTVQALDSLQERRTRQPAVTLDNLLNTLEERNINIPPKMREVIDELRQAGPIQNGENTGAQAQAG